MLARLSKEEFEALASHFQSEYTAEGEGFLLNVTAINGWGLEDIGGLKSALSKEKTNAAAGSKRIKELEAQFKDIDPVRAREALGKMEELEKWDPEEKAAEAKKAFEVSLTEKFGKDKDSLTKKHTDDLTALQGKYDVVAVQLKESIVDAEATRAITAAGGSIELLGPLVKQRVKMVLQDDGTFKPAIMDAEGNPTFSTRSGSTDWMTIAELVDGLKADKVYGGAFGGSGATGSGAGAGNSGSGISGSSVKISTADAGDVLKYRAAQDRADKAGVPLEMTG